MSALSSHKHPTLQRFEQAAHRRRQWDNILLDAYRFALPNHDPREMSVQGNQRDMEVFDNTAVNAVQWKKARLHGQLFPPFRQWVDFQTEEIMPDDLPDQGDFDLYMGQVRERFHQAIEVSNFHIEVEPALGDACISTGCLMVNQGTYDNPLRFEAVPIAQLIPEEGPDGMIKTMFRHWHVPARHVTEKWPEAKLPPGVEKIIAEKPNEKIEVVEAVLHEQQAENCRYEVWLLRSGEANSEHLLVERTYETSPAIVFRMDKAPGEWMGRGPVLNVLGDIKTANKVVELVLKNASISVAGIWQADDDGVLNPANIKLVPGSIIPKAPGSNGLQRLEPATNFDMSQMVLQRLQDSIRTGIMGPSLPPEHKSTRTALEIDIRHSEQKAVELPMTLRLLTELDYPLTMRVLSILSSPSMIGSPYYIEPFHLDGRVVRPIPRAPLVRMQDQQEAVESLEIYTRAADKFPELIDQIVDRPAFLRSQLEKSSFPQEHLKAKPSPQDGLMNALKQAASMEGQGQGTDQAAEQGMEQTMGQEAGLPGMAMPAHAGVPQSVPLDSMPPQAEARDAMAQEAEKQDAPKQSSVKQTTTEKSAPKKAVTTKATPKKTPAKKTALKKTTTKKTITKKTAVKSAAKGGQND
ncbi:MAG: portal protein [Pseudomonadota bacterium]